MIKALILDDAKVIRSLLKLTLESDGIEVDSSKTVEQALDLAIQNEYDLMIIDYMLDDGHNGLEFIEAVKKQGKNTDTPCIMLSAEDGKSCKDSAQLLGVKAWVKKPFTPPGILKVIYKVLGHNFSEKNDNHSMHHHD